MEIKFYRCNVCGNVVIKTIDSGVDVVCCGEEMEELVPLTMDQGMEKHVPVWEREDDCTLKVQVGKEMHPMMPAHFIQFICLETEHGGQIVYLTSQDKPQALFCCCKDKPKAVYEYCNVHGLWKTDVV